MSPIAKTVAPSGIAAGEFWAESKRASIGSFMNLADDHDGLRRPGQSRRGSGRTYET
jgi:hypothetical protein